MQTRQLSEGRPGIDEDMLAVFEYWWLIVKPEAWNKKLFSSPEFERPLLLIRSQLEAGRSPSMLMAAIWNARLADWPDDEAQRLSLTWTMRPENVDRYAGAWEAHPYLGNLQWARLHRIGVKLRKAREERLGGLDDAMPELGSLMLAAKEGRDVSEGVRRLVAMLAAAKPVEPVPCPPEVLAGLERAVWRIGEGGASA